MKWPIRCTWLRHSRLESLTSSCHLCPSSCPAPDFFPLHRVFYKMMVSCSFSVLPGCCTTGLIMMSESAVATLLTALQAFDAAGGLFRRRRGIKGGGESYREECSNESALFAADEARNSVCVHLLAVVCLQQLSVSFVRRRSDVPLEKNSCTLYWISFMYNLPPCCFSHVISN